VSGYGVFSRPGEDPRVGYRVEDSVLDISDLVPDLNQLMARGPDSWRETQARVEERLDGETVPLADVQLHVPFRIADYVDFYSSLDHATNMGRILRPGGEALTPNWRHLPIGYHGRAGTVVVSGTPIRRPSGQRKPPDAEAPTFGPTGKLDIELELGFVVGVPSTHGEPVPISEALDHVFGAVLVNDWSARDIQAWEYQPLGPFLGKSFATSISPWVVPLAALEPHRVPTRPQEPEPLEYLRVAPWAYDLELEGELNGEVISRTNARRLYWNVEQQVAHLTSNGASLRTGDLLATGTISGSEPGSYGSLMELTWNGERPLELADGGTRTFLEDGDEITLRAPLLGEVTGRIEPAFSLVSAG
jgi:fumarylacetoacetase